ncbi:CobW family GTP-binding protein [Paenibacillus humicola]|uniref:CobW family GTP-binding protein n=1 Tax=Paenibacillus humicola TaxID=3110540 RepID=UPI00237B8DD0|nr:GTP-binding protein [Paenibacillus humicola]
MTDKEMRQQEPGTVPVHLLSGFLGSGKTTLLNRIVDHYKAAGVRAAVVMNELGEVNLDGQLIAGDVPMAEMLGGCICCTIRGDLGSELKRLVDEHRPEVVLIEATGAANPIEMMDAVTEASMLARVELRTVATVVDGPELLARSRKGGRTFKLMQDQIRCATDLIVNKADRLGSEELIEVQQLVRELNEYAPMTVTVRCMTELGIFAPDAAEGRIPARGGRDVHEAHLCGANCSHGLHRDGQEQSGEHYVSHEHVMTLTHYFNGPVDSEAFEALLKRLPNDVYRAKGIVTLTDTRSRFLFQYAYRESDFIRITPQGEVNDVAVFIGEHFAKDRLLEELKRLEEAGASAGNGNGA